MNPSKIWEPISPNSMYALTRRQEALSEKLKPFAFKVVLGLKFTSIEENYVRELCNELDEISKKIDEKNRPKHRKVIKP